MHINQTLNIESKPKTTNMELESPETRIRWVLIVDRKFLNTVLWGELKNQVKEGMLEEEPWKVTIIKPLEDVQCTTTFADENSSQLSSNSFRDKDCGLVGVNFVYYELILFIMN